MKKVIILLSLSLYTIGSINFINSENAFAAFPIRTESNVQTIKDANIVNVSNAQPNDGKANISSQQPIFSENDDNPTTTTSTTGSGGKSQLIALLLVIFVGGLGIHRFYLGYTWQGVVQLLTAGGCGIWALIDLVRIITGDLGPKNGDYDKTL